MGDDEVKGLDAEIEGEEVELVAKDGASFTVARRVAMGSELVSAMLENDKEETRFTLQNVAGDVLEKVVAYLEHHVGNPAREIERPLRSSNMRDVVDDWDADFVDMEKGKNMDQNMLFELILASNYMDVRPLLDLTCAKVASMIKGKTPEEIRKKFGIVNDFTPEEEEAVRAENKWAEES